MYGKIFDTVFTGTLYGSGPTVFAVWAYVIATAKPPGVVEINPKLLAGCIGTDVSDIKKALDILCAADADSRNPEQDGRRLIPLGGLQYEVVSFQKYRDLCSLEDKRAADRKRIAEKRAAEQMSQVVADCRVVSQSVANVAEREAEAEAKTEKKRVGRGSRFALTLLPDEWAYFCRKQRPDLDTQETFDRFRDYWQSMPGQRGSKVDWFATWRNWVRNERAKASSTLTTEQKAAEAMRLAEARGYQ